MHNHIVRDNNHYMSILNIILGWHTPQDVPIPSIHNAIAHLMSNALLMATRHEALENDVESGGVKNVATSTSQRP